MISSFPATLSFTCLFFNCLFQEQCDVHDTRFAIRTCDCRHREYIPHLQAEHPNSRQIHRLDDSR